MTLWLDEQISPFMAKWISEEFNIDCQSITELSLGSTNDKVIFEAARVADAVILTKDRDFVDLVTRLGSPPRIILLSCGNRSNEQMKVILKDTLARAFLMLLNSREALVEIA